MIAKSLRVYNLKFLEFIKKDLQKDKKDINLQHFLSALSYLSMNNSFPYEFFYKNKENLMSFIEAAEDLSEKKVSVAISMLEIFSRQRLMYCEKIIDRLLICIELNLPASDITQVARILYFYSRLKSSIKQDFVIKLI